MILITESLAQVNERTLWQHKDGFSMWNFQWISSSIQVRKRYGGYTGKRGKRYGRYTSWVVRNVTAGTPRELLSPRTK